MPGCRAMPGCRRLPGHARTPSIFGVAPRGVFPGVPPGAFRRRTASPCVSCPAVPLGVVPGSGFRFVSWGALWLVPGGGFRVVPWGAFASSARRLSASYRTSPRRRAWQRPPLRASRRPSCRASRCLRLVLAASYRITLRAVPCGVPRRRTAHHPPRPTSQSLPCHASRCLRLVVSCRPPGQAVDHNSWRFGWWGRHYPWGPGVVGV